MPRNPTLTQRQRKIAQVYYETADPIKAYREAGYAFYDEDGKQRKWVVSRAHEVLSKPLVKQELARLNKKDEQYKTVQERFTLDWTRKELMRLAVKAEQKGDIATASKNVVEVAKTCGHYLLDKEATIEHQLAMNEQEEQEIQVFAEFQKRQSLIIESKVLDE